MRNIILIALEQEAPNMTSWDNVFFTGVGKVNAGITAGKLIERYKPETVFNLEDLHKILLVELGENSLKDTVLKVAMRTGVARSLVYKAALEINNISRVS